jgi:hypothetical protein
MQNGFLNFKNPFASKLIKHPKKLWLTQMQRDECISQSAIHPSPTLLTCPI